MSLPPFRALVIGAGPAGLMAAEMLSQRGIPVFLAEAKPSPARKFLMAGKSGLNLTKDEPAERFTSHYDAPFLAPMLAAFGPEEVKAWATGLGQEIFTGSTGRVFPTVMKASPLLRSWLARLEAQGVHLRSGWRWSGFAGEALVFDTPEGQQELRPEVTILALGGASWQRLGSDAAWVPWLAEKGVEIAPWKPANMGFEVGWSAHMTKHFGTPIKGAALRAGGAWTRGEFVLSERGIEGGGIYTLSAAIREGAALEIDLLPALSEAEISARLAKMRAGESMANRLRKLGLAPASVALLMEWAKGDPLAAIKRLRARLDGPRPLDEAISVAGGIRSEALTEELELKALPRIFACGEMLDWEAPTGGYLLTACFATGRWAGLAAGRHLLG